MSNDTSIIRTPGNTNFISPDKFFFVIPTLPFGNYFGQAITVPGVNTTPANRETPFVVMPHAGDKLVYDALTVSLLVDEDLRAWEEIYNWMKGFTKPHGAPEYSEQKKKGVYHDGILGLNTNTHNSNLRIKYKDMWPTNLTGFFLSFSEDSSTQLTCDVTFAYESFVIERI
jgi:hypothetical protein